MVRLIVAPPKEYNHFDQSEPVLEKKRLGIIKFIEEQRITAAFAGSDRA